MPKNKSYISDIKIVEGLYNDISFLIEQSKKHVALVVNKEMTLLYWYIGKTISTSLLKNKRADYGESIIATLSQQLSIAYGKGFTASNINRMINFYKKFNDEQKIATLSQQLSWSHFIELIVLDDALKKEFYLELCRRERWAFALCGNVFQVCCLNEQRFRKNLKTL